MRLEQGPYGPRLVLSRRNVLSLLHKVDWEGSGKRIISGNRDFDVTVESDEIHYAHEARGPYKGVAGKVHPETQAFINKREGKQQV